MKAVTQQRLQCAGLKQYGTTVYAKDDTKSSGFSEFQGTNLWAPSPEAARAILDASGRGYMIVTSEIKYNEDGKKIYHDLPQDQIFPTSIN